MHFEDSLHFGLALTPLNWNCNMILPISLADAVVQLMWVLTRIVWGSELYISIMILQALFWFLESFPVGLWSLCRTRIILCKSLFLSLSSLVWGFFHAKMHVKILGSFVGNDFLYTQWTLIHKICQCLIGSLRIKVWLSFLSSFLEVPLRLQYMS